MNPLTVPLKEVDRVEILTLIDNFVDVLLENTEVVTRPPKAAGDEIPTNTLLAEHGLCLLVSVQHGAEKHTIMFDTGYNNMSVLHNMDILAVDPNEIEAIVLSHAHMDHTGALHAILRKISNPIPLVVHPDAFLYPRFLEEKDGLDVQVVSIPSIGLFLDQDSDYKQNIIKKDFREPFYEMILTG